MNQVELQWLQDEKTLKEALQGMLGCSGQQLKKYFSSKQLSYPQSAQASVSLPLDLVNHMKLNPHYEGPPVKILTETKDYLAVHKPPGIHSHPHAYSDRNTVLNYLAQERMWDVLRVNENSYDRGLLFRLDFETSGVLLLAKNEAFFAKVRNDFHREIKHKLYWAVVEGSFDKEGMHTHYFSASGERGAKQKVTSSLCPGAQVGTLEARKVMETAGKSLLLINLRQGLRHQIRAQLASLGFPIVGDEFYGGVKGERLYLHAWRYEWTEMVEDASPELFGDLFDLNSAFQMGHNMVRTFQGH